MNDNFLREAEFVLLCTQTAYNIKKMGDVAS